MGSLSRSQRRGIITLSFKKGDRLDPKNWRPISLLNVDYKIASRSIAARLLKVIHLVVDKDQSCGVPGRTIFDNLFLLRDTLDYVNITNEPGILLSLDQEKAFDRVDRSFLMNTLQRFGFGPFFRRWISSLYSQASMRVIVNGFLTDSIPINRGVRQGDSLSPLLYILCAETLAANIRHDQTIQAFLLPGAGGRYFKIQEYADDSTCFVKDVYSLNRLFLLLSKYEQGTGAKLNMSKTEAMWLGSWRTCPAQPLGLTWVSKMKILGVWFSNGNVNVDPENWLPRLSKLEANLNLWTTRSLSFVGKTLIVNIIGASKLLYLAKVLPLPEFIVVRFKNLVYPFLWGSKIETIKRTTLSAPIRQGGLGLIDFICKSKALKVSSLVHTISRPDSKDFYLLKYFVGSQLARLRSDWSFLRDNSTPSAISPTAYYNTCLQSLSHLVSRLRPNTAFDFTSKSCYQEFLKETMTSPILSHQWAPFVNPSFDLDNHWSLVRDPFTENFKNDLSWLIILRAIKVRDSLHMWGYADSNVCAHCQRKETIDHCFLNCK